MAPSRRILVVDDDSPFQALMRELLTDEGYEVAVASSGAAGLEMLRAAPPALLILDIRLEEATTGLRLIEQMRREDALMRIPVIVCTADLRFLHTFADDLRRYAVVTLPKPFDLDAMLAAVRHEIGAADTSTGATNGFANHHK